MFVLYDNPKGNDNINTDECWKAATFYSSCLFILVI